MPDEPRKQDAPAGTEGFGAIPRSRMLELVGQVAEIQQYQKENDLEDKGDPPDEEESARRQ